MEMAIAEKPVKFSIEHPGKLSRRHLLAKILLGWIYVGIPHGIILYLYQIMVSVVMFFAFWIILFTGKYPKGMFDFNMGYLRWSARVIAYMGMMRDEYPPFNGRD